MPTPDRIRRVTILHDHVEVRPPLVDHVAAAVAGQGMHTNLLALSDDLDVLGPSVRKLRPDLVFNLATRLAGNPRLQPDIAAALEVLGVTFTGAGPAGLYLEGDPALAQKLLGTHGVPTASLHDENAPGVRDLVLGLLGNDPLEVMPEDEESPAWQSHREKVIELSQAAHEILRLRDYGLVVVRLLASGPAVVSAVANPPLTRDGDLARCARNGGWRYDDVVHRIMSEAWERQGVESARATPVI
jgi:hypothetical protein